MRFTTRHRGRTSRPSAISERLTNISLHRISGQVRRVNGINRNEKKRRVTAEPMIGHVKAGHCMGCGDLNDHDGGRTNAVPAASGSDFHLLVQ